MMHDDELTVLADADRRALAYVADIGTRRVFPDPTALDGLSAFDTPLPTRPSPIADTLELLDGKGSPATVASNGPSYFGFFVGASHPAGAAAERLMLAWDQGAPMAITSPAGAAIEAVAARWLLEILDLPTTAAVGFGTSATSCSLTCLAAARRTLLARAGWELDEQGLAGAPRVRVVVSATAHVASPSSFSRRPTMKTKAPCSANFFAEANPMPVAPPVTTATLLSSWLMVIYPYSKCNYTVR